jgi:hypothetical protein
MAMVHYCYMQKTREFANLEMRRNYTVLSIDATGLENLGTVSPFKNPSGQFICDFAIPSCGASEVRMQVLKNLPARANELKVEPLDKPCIGRQPLQK